MDFFETWFMAEVLQYVCIVHFGAVLVHGF